MNKMNHYTHPQHHHHSTLQMMMDNGGCGDNTGVGGGVVSNGGAIQSQLMMNNTVQSGNIGMGGITMSVNPINGSYHAHPTVTSQSNVAQTMSFEQGQQQAQHDQQFDSGTQAYSMYVQYHPSDGSGGGGSQTVSSNGPGTGDVSQQYSPSSWNNKSNANQTMQPAQIVNQYEQTWNNSWNPQPHPPQSTQRQSVQQQQPLQQQPLQQQPLQQQPLQQQPLQQQTLQQQPPPTSQQYHSHPLQQTQLFSGQIDQIAYHPEIMISPSSSQQQQQQQPQQTVSTPLAPTSVADIHQTIATNNKKPAGKRKKLEPGVKESKIPTAYALFFRDIQPQIKQECPRANFGEISKIVSKRWEMLAPDAKEVFKQKANFEKKNLRLNAASNKAKLLAQDITTSSGQQQQQPQQVLQHMQQQQQPPPPSQHDQTIQFISYQNQNQVGTNQYLDHSHQHLQQSFNQDNLYLSHQIDQNNAFVGQSSDVGASFQQQQQQSQQQQQNVPPGLESYSQDSNSLHSNNHDMCYDPLASLLNFDGDNFDNFDFSSNDFMSELTSIADDAVFNDHSLLMNDELSGESFLSTSLGVGTPTGNTIGLSDDSQLSNHAMIPNLNVPGNVLITSNVSEMNETLSNDSNQVPLTVPIQINDNIDGNISTQTQQSKPSENGNTLPICERFCTRNGCGKPAIDCEQWSAAFCSEDCCMKHCEDVFNRWRMDRANLASSNASITADDAIKVNDISNNSNNSPASTASNLNLVVS